MRRGRMRRRLEGGGSESAYPEIQLGATTGFGRSWLLSSVYSKLSRIVH